MLNANLELTNIEIISQRHLDLIIEKFLLKKTYDKNEITYYVYGQIKEEIDKEILEIIENFNHFLKSKNKDTQTPKQSYNEHCKEDENDTRI